MGRKISRIEAPSRKQPDANIISMVVTIKKVRVCPPPTYILATMVGTPIWVTALAKRTAPQMMNITITAPLSPSRNTSTNFFSGMVR